MRNRGYVLSAGISEATLLATYVGIARGEGTATLGMLLRNPWFIFTQAPFAARNARRLIQRLRAEFERDDVRGFLNLVDLGEGRLLAHQRKKAQATLCIERIQLRLREGGIEHDPAPVAALAAEIERLT